MMHCGIFINTPENQHCGDLSHAFFLFHGMLKYDLYSLTQFFILIFQITADNMYPILYRCEVEFLKSLYFQSHVTKDISLNIHKIIGSSP